MKTRTEHDVEVMVYRFSPAPESAADRIAAAIVAVVLPHVAGAFRRLAERRRANEAKRRLRALKKSIKTKAKPVACKAKPVACKAKPKTRRA
jgi:hypothetical protein